MLRYVLVIAIVNYAALAIGGVGSIDDLQCPCLVGGLERYLDGGTIGGEINGSHGEQLEFCLEGLGRPIGIEELGQGPRPRQFFVGAKHPDMDGAVALVVGSPEELRLVEILDAWVADQFESQRYSGLLAEVDAVAERHERLRIAKAHDLDREQIMALEIRSVLIERKNG